MNKLTYYIPIVLCAGLAAFFCWFPITDTDIFWHLAAGREMVRTGNFLYADPFSFTLALPQWIDVHWLFQLLVYGLFLLGGLKMLMWFKVLAVACSCLLLCSAVRSRRFAYATAFLCAVFFFEARYLVCERPVLITMLCMAAYVFLFERVKQGMSKRFLWLCVPLQLLWANSQGLYPLGIFIVAAYWVESVMFRRASRGRRSLVTTGVLLACAVSCIVTPYGIQGLLLPFRLFGSIAPVAHSLYSLNISENEPLLALSGFEARYRVAVIATAIGVCTLFFVNRRMVRPAHVILFAGFLLLAYSAVRNVLLFFLMAAPIAGFGVMKARIPRRFAAFVESGKLRSSLSAAAGIAVLLAWPVAGHLATLAVCPPGRTLSPFRFPEKIAEHLAAHPVRGEMFNDIRYGGYLIWTMYPQKRVFADGRIIIRPPRFFSDYLALCDQPELFSFAAQKFNLTSVIVPSAIFTHYRKLIRWLYHSPDWHLEYTDGSSFLLVKNSISKAPAVDLADPGTILAISDSICAQWQSAPYVRKEALGYFADELEDLGLSGSAETVRNTK
jgi:hypothetical protein